MYPAGLNELDWGLESFLSCCFFVHFLNSYPTYVNFGEDLSQFFPYFTLHELTEVWSPFFPVVALYIFWIHTPLTFTLARTCHFFLTSPYTCWLRLESFLSWCLFIHFLNMYPTYVNFSKDLSLFFILHELDWGLESILSLCFFIYFLDTHPTYVYFSTDLSHFLYSPYTTSDEFSYLDHSMCITL